MGFDYVTIRAAQWDTFFELISTAHSVTSACKNAKIAPATAYRIRKDTPYIAERWNEAIKAGKEFLEDTARKRAVDGISHTKGVYYEGKLIAEEVEIRYSDAMLALLLKGRMPMYRDNPQIRVEVAVAKELERIFDILRKALIPETYRHIVELIAADDTSLE